MEENQNLLNDNTVTEQEQEQQPQSLEDKLIKMRQDWTAEVEELNKGLKNINSLDSLLNTIFTKRQQAVDAFHGTYNILQKVNSTYKVKYAELYNKMKLGSNGIRYTDTAVADQCNAQLMDEVSVIAQLKSFTDFMSETIKTIDGIQYAITSKLKIYEIMNGLKY